ncbi:MAG TPA: arsenite methyltransferase [Candidatus Anoxymicrobiaceae bacterium]|jgi:arsenite methyltransferase
MKNEEIKKVVREGYTGIAQVNRSCCAPGPSAAETVAKGVGYTDEDLSAIPEGANLGLGCGNPVAMASLSDGETVLDLGSGAGVDCFIAAGKVGPRGRVIGVDMTPEMIDRARENVSRGGYDNVEFRLGEIEHLPVADSSVDVIISNCVINLAPDKNEVFAEAYRALKPGGRLMVSDIVLTRELPPEVKESVDALVGCIAGAWLKGDYVGAVKNAGFEDVEITDEQSFRTELLENDPAVQSFIKDLGMSTESLADLAQSAVSVKVRAVRPAR